MLVTAASFAAVGTKLAWYVSRSAGMVAWGLVTASIAWGLVLSSKTVRRRGAPAWFLDLHRFLATMSIVLVLIHVVALLFDDYAKIVVREIALPFASPSRAGYRPAPIAWGIVGAYVLVALQITSWLMHRIPRRVWHAIHLGSFLLFTVATVHGFQIGTDRRNVLVEWVAISGFVLVASMITVRLRSLRGARHRKRPAHPPTRRSGALATVGPDPEHERVLSDA